MYVIWVFVAVVFFTVGGVSIRFSAGMTRLIPTLVFLAFFVVGAAFQALALREAELDIAYVAVLGLEGVLVAALSVVIFSEPVGRRNASEYL